jgi:hypothetical protein
MEAKVQNECMQFVYRMSNNSLRSLVCLCVALRREEYSFSHQAACLSLAMRIFVKSITAAQVDRGVEYDVEPGDSVQTLKDKIHDKTGFPLCFQRLIFQDKQLEEFRMLGDYVQQGSQIMLVGKLLGA